MSKFLYKKEEKLNRNMNSLKKVLPTINHALQDIQHMCGPCLNYNKHLTLLIAWHIYCLKTTLLYKRIFKTTAFQYKPSLVLESQDQINKSTWLPFSMQQALSSPKSKTRAVCQWCSSEVGGSTGKEPSVTAGSKPQQGTGKTKRLMSPSP